MFPLMSVTSPVLQKGDLTAKYKAGGRHMIQSCTMRIRPRQSNTPDMIHASQF